MTMVERVAAAIAAGRTGSAAGREAYRADAEKMIARYDEAIIACRDARPRAPSKAR